VVEFKEGEQAVFEAFDKYFLGRPKIDRIVWRFITDSNATLAGVLADEIDFSIRSAVTFEGAQILKRDWEAKGKGTVYLTPTNYSFIAPSPTNPIFGWNAPNQAKIRQALLHAINRDEIVATLQGGIESPVHAPISSKRPLFAKVEASVTKYEYNLDKAKQLMAEAGWRPGSDGILVNAAGERFSIESRTEAGAQEREQLQAAINDYWKRLGVDVKIANLPRRLLDAEENRNRFPGVFLWSEALVIDEWANNFHGRTIPTEANKYSGHNYGGWTGADKILDERDNSPSPEAQDRLAVEFCQAFSKELPFLPLLYQSERLTLKKGISGLTPRVETGGANATTWNIHLWEKP
jgi:peptide/nickel transport system substrate-binding protein